jgi:hypothetical protein
MTRQIIVGIAIRKIGPMTGADRSGYIPVSRKNRVDIAGASENQFIRTYLKTRISRARNAQTNSKIATRLFTENYLVHVHEILNVRHNYMHLFIYYLRVSAFII